MDNPIIFHIDMDAFFAAIEVAQNPALKGKPVIIGGNPDQRGVVSTCSYEARKYGVRSAMSLFEAKKRCPKGIFLEGNYSLYKEYSEKIQQIFYTCTPYVEVVSIDEAYLDATLAAAQYGGGQALGEMLKKIIFQQTQLTCSIGIASNKMVAKIAASRSKPNGLLLIPPGQESTFLAPLPISYLPGVGEKTNMIMVADGYKTIEQLQNVGLEILMEQYGSWGYHLYHSSFGRNNSPVHWEESPPKSIGAETTFEKDLSDPQLIIEALQEVCEKASRRLKRHKMRAKGLSLKLRDQDFRTISRSHTFETHLNNPDRFFKTALALFEKNYDGTLPIRLVGVTLEKLNDGYWQPTFWDN